MQYYLNIFCWQRNFLEQIIQRNFYRLFYLSYIMPLSLNKIAACCSMIKILIAIILTIGFSTYNKSFSQTHFSTYNQAFIDSARARLKQVCNNYGTGKKIVKARVKYDIERIGFLNDFYNRDLSKTEIIHQVNKFFKRHWGFDSINLGAFTKYNARIYSEGYLQLHISFSTFNDEIIFKKIYFNTAYFTNCIDPNIPAISTQDINYLEQYCIPVIDFPVSFSSAYGTYLSCDTLFRYKLSNLQQDQFHFFLSTNEEALNNLSWFEIDTYMLDYIPESVLKLRDQTALLFQLLYSPNYVLSIYAAEMLIYLKETNQLSLSQQVLDKIEAIRNAAVKIRWQYSDVVKSGVYYKDLGLNTQAILNKVSKAIKQNQETNH